jgi:uncharacterized membrane protein YphA (DoxX/SURF4 family)
MQKINAYLPLVARVLLGLVFTVFGLNGFFGFMSMPPMPDAANDFMGALAQSGYFMPFLKAIETLAGIALLIGLFAPVALVLLAPVIINITLFHVFLAPGGLGMALVLCVLALYLGWSYRDAYRPMFQTRAVPVQRKRLERLRESPAGA